MVDQEQNLTTDFQKAKIYIVFLWPAFVLPIFGYLCLIIGGFLRGSLASLVGSLIFLFFTAGIICGIISLIAILFEPKEIKKTVPVVLIICAILGSLLFMFFLGSLI